MRGRGVRDKFFQLKRRGKVKKMFFFLFLSIVPYILLT